MKTKISGQLILAASILIAVFLIYLTADRYLGLKQAELKQEAVRLCLEASSYTFDDGAGVVTREPIENTYQNCLELMDYK